MTGKRNITIHSSGIPNSMLKQLAAHIAYCAITDYHSAFGESKVEIEKEIYSKWFQEVILPILDISIDKFEEMLDCKTDSVINNNEYNILQYLYKHTLSETAKKFKLSEGTVRKYMNRIGIDVGEIAKERQKNLQPVLF